MNNDIRSEHICSQLRDLLKEDSVKLWLSPYYKDEKCDDNEIEQLAGKYSATLKLPIIEVKETLVLLQDRSLTRLREQDQYRTSGLCTVRVKISSCNSPDEATCSKNSSGPRQIAVSIQLLDTGKILLQKVADESGIPAYRLKLIAQGRIIDNDIPLASQGIKNSSQIMAVVLTENPNEINEATSRHNLLEDTRADVMTLVNAQKTSYFELQNQQGNSLDLPETERKALLLAMALHERGKTILSRGDHALALVLFLEADKQFEKCDSELLKSVDNAALLNLDIAWCYLCLRSVSYLPDAQKRLQDCQNMLARSYGPNMERVIALKGSAGNEAVLMMRLHLLQGIVMFHQSKIEDSRRLLTQAESELKRLKVNDEDLCSLISLGYRASEARLALRAAHGDISTAEVYIGEWRREKEEASKRNLQRQKLERERQKLGLCADGEKYVEPSLVQMLVSMGFEREVSICALAHTNNVLSRAVEIIHEHPEFLQQPKGRKKYRTDLKDLEQIVLMGFDRLLAKKALKKQEGNVQRALDDLVRISANLGGNVDLMDFDLNDGAASSESDHDAQDGQNAEEAFRRLAEASQNQEEAYKRLAPDIENSEDNHLDQSLIAEERFLTEYKILLDSIAERN